MTQEEMQASVDALLLTSRSQSDVGAVITTSGILVICLAMIDMLPAWSELKDKDSAYWWSKMVAMVIAIICTVILVRMLTSSTVDQQAAANSELFMNHPVLKGILDSSLIRTGVTYEQLQKKD